MEELAQPPLLASDTVLAHSDVQSGTVCGLDRLDLLTSRLEQQILAISRVFKIKAPQDHFSPSEWLVLSAMARGQGDNLKDIATVTGIALGTTSKILRRLALLRLVHWQHNPLNRRNYVLAITELGASVHRKTRAGAKRRQAMCFVDLSEDEVQQLSALLERCLP